MSIRSAAFLFLLTFLTNDIYCRESESSVPARMNRDIQEYMGDAADPNFWPVRGRRDESPVDRLSAEGVLSLRRGGRKPKEEETGVFWAGRGRSFDASEAPGGAAERLGNHKDRFTDPAPWIQDPGIPGWIWLGRREAKTSWPIGEGNVVCPSMQKSYPNEKREILQPKLCHLKRKSESLIREVPQLEQFWPVRGKKAKDPGDPVYRGKRPMKGLPTMMDDDQFWPVRGKRQEESWQENLHDLKMFWPVRGRRD